MNKYSNLRNNFNLKGKAPATKNLKYINSDCNYQNTSVCFTEEDKDKRCTYPGGGYVCSTCKENATLGDDGICQCNTGYLGTGYIDCYNGKMKIKYIYIYIYIYKN